MHGWRLPRKRWGGNFGSRAPGRGGRFCEGACDNDERGDGAAQAPANCGSCVRCRHCQRGPPACRGAWCGQVAQHVWHPCNHRLSGCCCPGFSFGGLGFAFEPLALAGSRSASRGGVAAKNASSRRAAKSFATRRARTSGDALSPLVGVDPSCLDWTLAASLPSLRLRYSLPAVPASHEGDLLGACSVHLRRR